MPHFFEKSDAYWKRVVDRAYGDSMNFLGINQRKAITTFVSTLIGSLILYFFFPAENGGSKLLGTLCVLAGFWVIFVAVFFGYFLVVTPHKLHEEDLAQAAEEKSVIETQRKAAEEQARAIAAEKEQIALFAEKVKRSNPMINFKRRELEKLIDRFKSLIGLLQQSHNPSVETFYGLDRDGKNFVEKEFGTQTDYALKYPFRDTHTTKIRYDSNDFQHFIAICNYRVSVLEELLGHFE